MKTVLTRYRKNLLVLVLTLGSLRLAASALSWNGFTFAEWWGESHSGLVLNHAPTRAKVVALTFDDGPDPQTTPRILAILRRYHAHATFFMIGRQVQAYPELAQQVVAEGHTIGNHTETHPYLCRKSRAEVRGEIAECGRTLQRHLHMTSHLFRPPRGDWNPTIYREAKREGYHLVLWTVAVEHHEAKTPRAMAVRALRLVRPGGILLMHDGTHCSRESTVEALPLILDGLKKRGYRIVAVPELFHIPGDDLFATRSNTRT